MASAAHAKSLESADAPVTAKPATQSPVISDSAPPTATASPARAQQEWLASSVAAWEQPTYPLAARMGLIVGGSLLLWGAIVGAGVLLFRIS